MWVKVVTKGIVSGLKELGMQFFLKKKKNQEYLVTGILLRTL